jgi:hypothetical protein
MVEACHLVSFSHTYVRTTHSFICLRSTPLCFKKILNNTVVPLSVLIITISFFLAFSDSARKAVIGPFTKRHEKRRKEKEEEEKRAAQNIVDINFRTQEVRKDSVLKFELFRKPWRRNAKEPVPGSEISVDFVDSTGNV